MDADGIGLQRHRAAIICLDGTLFGHLQHPRHGGVLVRNHCTGGSAEHEGAVRLIAAVSEHLAGHGQTDGVGGLDHLTAGERQQHRTGGRGLHRTADGRGQRRVLGGHIVQRTMGFDVVQRHTGCFAEGL